MNDNANPKISVIVPVYNIEKYVEKCISSIANQSYENLQIILVDDGSKDNGGKICDKYALSDIRIEVIHKQNGGLSDARNAGIDRAKGELISFIDGDDWIHPQFYELMIKALIDNDADISVCQYQQKNEEVFLNKKYNNLSANIVSGTEAFTDMRKILSVAWNKLYRKEIFDDISYPVGKLHEDEFVIHKILRKCNRVSVIDEPLYFYSLRDGSITSKINMNKVNDALQAYKERVDFCKSEVWTEVIPVAVRHYCDYCLSTYYNLKKNVSDADEYDLKRIWKAESDMYYKNLECNLNEKYQYFAKSPKSYENWIKKERIKSKIRKMFSK